MLNKILYFLLFTCLISCRKISKEEVVAPQSSEMRFVVPANFPPPVYNFENNPLSKETFELGRMLFYDPVLSNDSTISCATCHQQFAAFSNLDHATSHGLDGLFGIRNSPSIQNAAWTREFMWDGGINHIEVMPIDPITNPVEMGETLTGVVKKLKNHPRYPGLFKKAFKEKAIDDAQVLKALAQFMACLTSADSKYDKYVRNEPGGEMNSMELEGLHLFVEKCSTCHKTDLFTDFSYRNNGLFPTSIDSGRARITGNAIDRNKFKVPSLRNVALSRPYMHDGRFYDLEQVLDHYHAGVEISVNLDQVLLQNGYTGIDLTDPEKQKIIAFLHTLTDNTFIVNPKFSDPGAP